MSGLTHLDEHGRATMVDTSDKPSTTRRAKASARVLMSPETIVPLTHIDVRAELKDFGVYLESEVITHAQTGVEMEALTAVSVAALTVYDMCKAIDKSMTITEVRLELKTGGKSGDYHRE